MNLHATHARILMLLAAILAAGCPAAQRTVARPERWLATVDGPTQQIVVSWSPSADSATLGYHLCTGSPCLDYDTLFGRLDTLYRCIGQAATEAHLYRLHVFDSAYNVSPLTPYFGNIVLEAAVPPCDSVAHASWNAYGGMPSGVGRYGLYAQFLPADHGFGLVAEVDSGAPLRHSLLIPAGATEVRLMVSARSRDGRLTSQSNIVSVRRGTSDTARFFFIESAEYLPFEGYAVLSLNLDTAFRAAPYCLQRQRNGGQWQQVACGVGPGLYADRGVSLRDTLVRYRLCVTDACGLVEHRSAAMTLRMPPPEEPSAFLPSYVVAGDEHYGSWQPVLHGVRADDYSLHIYNRQGLLVYASAEPLAPWTPDPSLPQGAYTYALRVHYTDNTIHTHVGTILLLK